MANGNGGHEDVWKWVAAILAAILLAGSPAIVSTVRQWTLLDDVDRVDERAQELQTRLTVSENEIDRLKMQLTNLEELVSLLQQGG